jgi:hypothetical protein
VSKLFALKTNVTRVGNSERLIVELFFLMEIGKCIIYVRSDFLKDSQSVMIILIFVFLLVLANKFI